MVWRVSSSAFGAHPVLSWPSDGLWSVTEGRCSGTITVHASRMALRAVCGLPPREGAIAWRALSRLHCGAVCAAFSPGDMVATPADAIAAAATAATAAAASTCRVAVAQMTSVADVDANLGVVAGLVQVGPRCWGSDAAAGRSAAVLAPDPLTSDVDAMQEAASRGCAMLFLPENCAFLGSSPAESLALAQPLSGPLLGRYCALAAACGLWLSVGGFQERGPDPQRLYNCHAVIDARGGLVAAYRKIHLFNVDVPGGPVLLESRRAGMPRWLAQHAGRLGRGAGARAGLRAGARVATTVPCWRLRAARSSLTPFRRAHQR